MNPMIDKDRERENIWKSRFSIQYNMIKFFSSNKLGNETEF